MKIRIQGWPVIALTIFFLWFLLVPLWRCAKHLESIRAKIEMHFGPGPGDELINFGPGPQDEAQ